MNEKILLNNIYKRHEKIRQARLRLLEFSISHSMDELLTATLDEMEILTGSSIGFYHFLEADQKTLSSQNWSTNTLNNMCTAVGKYRHYDIAEAGVWADCVHERRAVIHKDYSSLPHRKGMPEGHPPVIRELVVPIFRNNLIKAIVGVGNKPADYDESDIEIISQLGDLSWDIIERKRVEEERDKLKAQLSGAVELAKLGPWEYDITKDTYTFNDYFYKIYRTTADEVGGYTMSSSDYVRRFIHPNENLPGGNAVKRYLESINPDEIQQLEHRIVYADGDAGHVVVKSYVILDANGKINKIYGVNQDITERKMMEEEKIILNQIANVFLTIPDEAMYGEVLAIVLEVMKSRFGIFGYIAKNGDLIIPSLTREIWDECQVPDKSIVFSADSWGDSIWGRAIGEKKAFYSDGPFRTPKGHIHIDHFLTVPIIYAQETIGLISVANKEGGYIEEDKDLLERIASRVSPILHARLQRDNQEQRRMEVERDLKESEEKYRLLITNAGEAIFIVQDEVMKFPNPKALEMIGYSAEELSEIPFTDLIHAADKDSVLEGHLRLLEGKQHPEAFPFRIIDKKDKEIWVQLTTAPIIWEKKPGILCFLRDVTEEKKLETQFMHAQKMQAVGRLAGGVAHDFNNMLGVILGQTEMILMGMKPGDPHYTKLEEIQKAAKRSADLTRQLLAFARKQTISPKVLDLNETIEGMLKMLRRLIGEDINLVWEPGTHLWTVKMDPTQIDQILANLCVNARDAISYVGKVTIETKNAVLDKDYSADRSGFIPGEYVMLAVSDDGCGMDEATQAQVFEPFFSTKKVSEGTGLGLATVYGIVKQNNGFINVYSEVGKGTTFKIYIPRHEGAIIRETTPNLKEIPSGHGEIVLLVEDDPSILNMGEAMLKRLGYMVLPANDPIQALDICKTHEGKIHLLITDVVMPQMSGKVLADQIQNIKPEISVLYMSGYTANTIAHRGILGAEVNFIPKPFSLKDLATKVQKILDGGKE